MKFPDGVTLETERLFIRPLNEEEMKNLADSYIEKDSKMYKAYSEMLELSKENPEDYLWYTAWGFFTKESGNMIGDACFKGPPAENNPEIGYGINEEFWGRGIASEGVPSFMWE